MTTRGERSSKHRPRGDGTRGPRSSGSGQSGQSWWRVRTCGDVFIPPRLLQHELLLPYGLAIVSLGMIDQQLKLMACVMRVQDNDKLIMLVEIMKMWCGVIMMIGEVLTASYGEKNNNTGLHKESRHVACPAPTAQASRATGQEAATNGAYTHLW